MKIKAHTTHERELIMLPTIRRCSFDLIKK